MLGDYLTSLFQSSFPLRPVISNMGLIRDSIGDCGGETSFQHLEQYGTQRGKEEETREKKGRKKERKLQGERKRDGRDDREKDGGSRETEIGLREEYVTEKKQNQNPINKP